MKKAIRYTLLAGCAVGILALSNKFAQAEDSMPGMSCCGGMNMATPTAQTSTNTIPDLLATCPVSGNKLGEMGNPYVFTYKDQEVKLCCKSCKKKFDADAEKYINLIRAADKKP